MLATQQLTEFLAAVADRQDPAGVRTAAVEHAARALRADVAVILAGPTVAASAGERPTAGLVELVASTGLAPGRAQIAELVEVAAGRLALVQLPDAGLCAAAAAPIDGPQPSHLVLLRAGVAGFTSEERGLLRAMARALEQRLAAMQELETDLRRAVLRGEFMLCYQPIVRLRTGELIGLEALVRWRHPSRGVIPPLDFIPLAEETGMIMPIGEWVLREACRQAARWNGPRPGAGPGVAAVGSHGEPPDATGEPPGAALAIGELGAQPLMVSVNLSAVQLDQPDLPDVVADALSAAGLPASCLVLELTESLLVDSDATAAQLKALRALGVRLAIDDFGTGYSSLAYLRRFPVDIIKIDKSFIDEVGAVPAASALAMGIVKLGQALQLATIAEGIEHAEQLDELANGECELGQGFLFAEPLTEAQVTAWLWPAAERVTDRLAPAAEQVTGRLAPAAEQVTDRLAPAANAPDGSTGRAAGWPRLPAPRGPAAA